MSFKSNSSHWFNCIERERERERERGRERERERERGSSRGSRFVIKGLLVSYNWSKTIILHAPI